MSNMKDTLVFKNKIKIEVIDRETGKVKQVVETENAVLNLTASRAIQAINNPSALANNSPVSVVNLFDSSKTKIKNLTGTWGTNTDTGTAWQSTLTATDNSTDTYTVQYLELDVSGLASYTNASYFANAQPTAISKGATDTLRISWTVSISYSSAP
jgi:hypothetical protein